MVTYTKTWATYVIVIFFTTPIHHHAHVAGASGATPGVAVARYTTPISPFPIDRSELSEYKPRPE